MMGGMGGLAGFPNAVGAMRSSKSPCSAAQPIDGTFTIVTTGDIRANNTDEGPTQEGDRQRLTWDDLQQQHRSTDRIDRRWQR